MARQRSQPRPDKPQAIPSNGGPAKYPSTKPERGKMWVRVRRPDGRVEWVQKDRPVPPRQKTETGGRDRNLPNPPPPDDPAPTSEDGTPEDGSTDPVDEDHAEQKTFDRAYWRQFFPGLPDDVLDDLQSFFNNTPNATDQELIGHLKGTDWYKREFGAFETGVLNGVFSAGGYDSYRNWKSSIKDAMGRYGIDEATASTVMDTAAKNGWGADRVEREFAADAYVKANQSEIQYTAGAFGGGALTQDELKALGQQQVGVGNDLGGQLQTRVQQAFQKMSRLFEGTLAVSDLGGTVQQDRRRRPDVGA